ncbi:hypothetical protein HHK36_002880 [Tetracentron sinense]|uniref:Smr domain-containing protein n=1 Tax=Tetracentron sinense TaxID=13715 RepID=A0A834ZQ80_TETSI|nr:hypothetical protein HHK36_002880 [Tetracentron sinense]
MTGCLQVSLPLSWNHHRQQAPPFVTRCALSKQGQRLLSTLDAAAGDPSAANRLIRKFVASSSKSVSLNALSHLLLSSSNTIHPHLSSLAFPMYTRITETPWFNWNPKLVANVVALLDKQGRIHEVETLISESVLKLRFRERDLALFFCDLIDSHSKHGSKSGVLDSYDRLKQLLSGSSSSYLNRRAYESMINAMCVLDLPHDADKMLEEMRTLGFKPSAYEFRSLVHGYGRSGSFMEMRRVLRQMEDTGHALDTICSNMVLSSYGTHGELSEMTSWLRKMKDSDIPISIRTYNSVLNSCPTIMLLLQVPNFLPLSIEELIEKLQNDEALLVKELIKSSVLIETLEWGSSEAKLDLHGMHLGSAYLIMLQWVKELRWRFLAGNSVIPAEITVVCGLGKHSSVRGESPVKALVKEMMVQMRSPMKIDRRNVACFVARGKAVKDWLCTYVDTV